ESQHWFLQVDRGGVEYVAELGYYAATDRAWISLSKSEAASTPSEAPSANKTITFGTVPTPASSAQSAESQPDLPALATVAKIPMGEAQQPRGFWFSINAELVVYGSTEPNATVMIGGRAIKLRPDGSFSYRFSLPDGEYELDVTAKSNDGDLRRAELKFSRQTAYDGEVRAEVQDPELKRPSAENVG